MRDYCWQSLASAVGVLLYVAGAVWWFGDWWFGERILGGPEILKPMFALLLFVVSAASTGLMVLGRPIHLYFSGSIKASIILLFSTLGWLVLFLIILTVVLSLY
jgi:hypothetical protein